MATVAAALWRRASHYTPCCAQGQVLPQRLHVCGQLRQRRAPCPASILLDMQPCTPRRVHRTSWYLTPHSLPLTMALQRLRPTPRVLGATWGGEGLQKRHCRWVAFTGLSAYPSACPATASYAE